MVNDKDAGKDRRQHYNFLMSEMKNSKHTVETIINTKYFKTRMIQLKSYGWKLDDEILSEANSPNSSSLVSSIINFGRSGVRDNKPSVYNKYNIADDSDGDSYTSDESESGGSPKPRLRPGYKHNLSDSSDSDGVSELTDTESVDTFHSSRSNTRSASSKGSPYQIFQMDM
jgi:hypothetical protein